MGQILLAREESHERTARECGLVAKGSPQHRIGRFERIEDRPLCHWSLNLDLYFARDLRQTSQMRREHHLDYHPDHLSVCTSTESTAGRSRTIGAQLSPASDDA